LSDTWTVWQGDDGKWYFHRQSRNGLIVGDGGQGYQHKSDAVDEATRQADGVPPHINGEEDC